MWKAYLNGVLFFDDASDDEALALTSAQLTRTFGAAGTLEMTVQPSNACYDGFTRYSGFVDLYKAGIPDPVWSGRVSDVDKDVDLNKTVSCEGMLAVLNDSVFRPCSYEGVTLQSLLEAIIASHNAQVGASQQIKLGNIEVADGYITRAYEKYASTMNRLTDLVSSYGGYLDARKTGGTLYLDWLQRDRNTVSGMTLELGENILSIDESDSSDNVLTILVPLGAKMEDDAGNVYQVTVTDYCGRDYIEDEELIAKYGRIVGTVEWNDITTSSDLYAKAITYLDELKAKLKEKPQLTVSTADFDETGDTAERLKPGFRVTVVSSPHEISDTYLISQQSLNLLNPLANRLILGKTASSYVQTTSKESSKVKGDIEADMTAITARIHHLQATMVTVDYIDANFATITELNAVKATIQELDVEKLSATEADLKYANIDFANIGTAAIENFFAKSGLIENLVVGDTTVTGELVGVTIKGALIEGGTVVADKLVVKGADGLYYKLNVDGESVETEQTEYNSLNGSVITAKSITATKIAVDDLVAFDATIGGFRITDNAIFSGVKESADNTTRGVYLDSTGQMAIGDGRNFLKFFYDETEQQWKLCISANSIAVGASGADVESEIEAIKGANAQLDIRADEIAAQVSQQNVRQDSMEQRMAQMQLTAEGLSVDVQHILDNGVDKVTTQTGYTFAADGLKIQKSGEEIANRLDHTGMYVNRGDDVMLQANNRGVIATDVTVRNYLVVGHLRFEQMGDGTSVFYV